MKRRRPSRPRSAVVKAPPLSHRPERTRCIICGTDLRADHASDLVCDCHPRSGFNPRCVQPHELDERITTLMLRAGGRPVVLTRALGCDETDSNRSAIRDAVRRINAAGFLRIVACGNTGRKLAHQWRLQRRIMQS